MFYEILDKKRLDFLPFLEIFKDDFYLAGGTALALQIGHRDSIDFDFFSKKEIDTEKLFDKIKNNFRDRKVLKIQEEENTLTVLIDEEIKLSFFTYSYSLLFDLIAEENIFLASIEDITCMKLSAILSRASNKDYIDLYYIFQSKSLDEILKLTTKKFPDIDENLILKSLVYFEDVQMEAIEFKNGKEVDFSDVKQYLRELVKEYSK